MKSLLRVFIASITLYLGCGSPEKKESTESTTNTVVAPKTPFKKSFNYNPQSPINGELFATIELGSSGLNYFIVNIDKENRWSLEKSIFGKSLLIEGKVDVDGIFHKIESYKREIIRSGVSKKNIYVIASSSAIELSVIQEIKARLAISGIKLRSVSASQEGVYDLIATIPSEFIEESFLVDIGSGNTKITWVSQNDTISLETFGSKYYLDGVQDTTVFRTVRDLVLNIPEQNRNLCFMLGGIPYEFASATSQREGRYAVLDKPSKYSPATTKTKSGKIIYNAIHLEPTFSYIFDWDANFSIGYLLSLKSK